jgi:CHAD domain-containing protein
MVRDSAQLQAAPDAAIHDLRKRAKRLRYAEEFFEGALKGKARRRAQKRALQALGRVQKNLGHRQDMVAARQTLAALVSGGVTAEVGVAAGHLHGQLGAKLTGLRGAKLKKAAADIAAARPR